MLNLKFYLVKFLIFDFTCTVVYNRLEFPFQNEFFRLGEKVRKLKRYNYKFNVQLQLINISDCSKSKTQTEKIPTLNTKNRLVEHTLKVILMAYIHDWGNN